MGKVCCAILLLCSMVIAIPIVNGIDQSPQGVAKWFKNQPKMKEKVTKLHFYFHDQVSGKNPTAVIVAQANTTFQSPNLFGLVVVIDDALTVGPEPNSTIVGRAQGTYSSAGLDDAVAAMSLNFVFTSGAYNGSTLSVLGRNAVLHTYREMPIVGGSGVFRLARGIATAKSYSFNATSGDAIVEYNVVVLHY
ncbi:hypothetical protein Vadar_024421 [Vaccinium darrowii]|uniref:Uncharacterized protein n=1 Tax=Vaccinium darrowii TaxID=229202 RepID=A0ACB7X3F1_9ERIC|nr:hypothetical protein Vadar_024421 [Vaccinium darrowii]